MKAKRRGQIDEQESEKTIVKIYNKSVATSLAHNLENKILPFIEPKKSLAHRIASEYVANFLRKHKMDVSFAMAQKETNEYIHEEHNAAWTARHLGIPAKGQLFHDLVEGCGITVYHTTTINEPEPQKKVYGVPDKDVFTTGDFLNSNENEFTGFLVTTDPEPPKKKEHKHHHRSRAVKEESNTFTQLEQTEEKYDRLGNLKRLPKPKLQEEPVSVHSETRTRTRTHTNESESSFFDEPPKPVDPKRKVVDELFIKAKQEKMMRGEVTNKSFNERFAALMVSSKLQDREVNAEKCEGFSTICTKDLSPETADSVDNPSLTAERKQGTSNALAKYMKSMKSPQKTPLPPDSDSRLPTGEPTTDIFETATRDGDNKMGNQGGISVPKPTQSRIMSSKAGSDALAQYEKIMKQKNAANGPIAAPEDISLNGSTQSIQSINSKEYSKEYQEEEEVDEEEEVVSEEASTSKLTSTEKTKPTKEGTKGEEEEGYEEDDEEEEVVYVEYEED